MKKLFIVAGLSLIAVGCYNDKRDRLYPSVGAVTCDTATVTYAHDILPVITTYCNISGCHDAIGAPSSANYNFTRYEDLKASAANGQLLPDIRWDAGSDPMPKGMPKLSDCDINKITRWVNQGALNN